MAPAAPGMRPRRGRPRDAAPAAPGAPGRHRHRPGGTGSTDTGEHRHRGTTDTAPAAPGSHRHRPGGTGSAGTVCHRAPGKPPTPPREHRHRGATDTVPGSTSTGPVAPGAPVLLPPGTGEPLTLPQWHREHRHRGAPGSQQQRPGGTGEHRHRAVTDTAPSGHRHRWHRARQQEGLARVGQSSFIGHSKHPIQRSTETEAGTETPSPAGPGSTRGKERGTGSKQQPGALAGGWPGSLEPSIAPAAQDCSCSSSTRISLWASGAELGRRMRRGHRTGQPSCWARAVSHNNLISDSPLQGQRASLSPHSTCEQDLAPPKQRGEGDGAQRPREAAGASRAPSSQDKRLQKQPWKCVLLSRQHQGTDTAWNRTARESRTDRQTPLHAPCVGQTNQFLATVPQGGQTPRTKQIWS
ncbi:calcium-binding protein P-like [Passer montanus]|uniref:calcium-binding protein P-like n=1 Tax=Passer montanus TaxID=9160 RepID=UPI00195FB57A|nr:calcium-binding protein P-like [Passer montanus]